MELMGRYEDNHFDLAIVDPPYGANDAINIKNNNQHKKQSAIRKNYKTFENSYPPKQYFYELFRVSKNQIIWGVNFYPLRFQSIYICLWLPSV